MIREATNLDIPEVTDLIYSILEEYGLKPDPCGTDADLTDIETNYIKNGGSFDVLLDTGGRVVGSVAIYRISEEVCELRKMYLDSSQRGQGKGKILLDHGISKARELGFKRITLETATVLKEAISLYISYGFMEFAAENESSRCDQTYYLDIVV